MLSHSIRYQFQSDVRQGRREIRNVPLKASQLYRPQQYPETSVADLTYIQFNQ